MNVRRPGSIATAFVVVAVASNMALATHDASAVRAATVVLDVRRTGGFAPAYTDFRAVPEHLVTTPQHFRPATPLASYPGPMLRPITISPVSAAMVRRIHAFQPRPARHTRRRRRFFRCSWPTRVHLSPDH